MAKPKSTGEIIVWILPVIGALLGTIVLFGGMASATGAPQEAVVCALACALSIIPYVFARAVTEVWDRQAGDED